MEWRKDLQNTPSDGSRFIGARFSRYGMWECEVVAWAEDDTDPLTSSGQKFWVSYWLPLDALPPAPTTGDDQ